MDSVKSQGKCGAEPGGEAGPAPLDLGELRQRLQDKKGPEFWRSLDELAATPDFEAMIHREFPRYASEWPSGFSRRRFLQLSSASLALAGLTGCTKQPIEKIVPYVRQPEQIIPGKPLFFATALTLSGYATGVLAESHEGRPTKIEGNPDHPASLGATDLFAQAAILTLYDPDRSQTILKAGRPGTWGGFVGEVSNVLRSLAPTGGDGLRILTGSVTSPTFAAQMQALLAAYPRARWHRWEPAAPHQAQAAARRALGAPLDKVYDFTQADVVLTIGSDAFCHGPAGVRYARDFASRRRVRSGGNPTMNRLYAVESYPENSSTVADHRLQLSPGELEAFTLALAQALGVAGAGGAAALSDENARKWVQVVAEDLRAHAGRSLVVADEYLSPALQVLVLGINQALGNVGRTLHFTEPVEADPVDQVQSIRELVADMNAGRVELLVMLDGVNPVYTAPADLKFADALQKVRLRVHHGLYPDETADYCHWHVNATHELESWGDARSFDGTVSIVQPLIEPLYDGKTAHEVLSALSNRADQTSYDLVREFWSSRLSAPEGFDTAWRRVLNAGLVPNTAVPRAGAAVNGGAVAQAASEIAAAAANRAPGRVTLLLRPDPTIWDGRFASNAWLQELPKPISKLVWDNALTVSPRTAERLKIDRYQIVTVAAGGRSVDAAVWILPGMADDTAYLTLGYGRTRAGKSTGQGWNAYALRTSNALWTIPGVEIRPTDEKYELACTQNHHLIRDEVDEDAEATEQAARRHVIRTGTLAQLQADPNFLQEHREDPKKHEKETGEKMSMYPRWDYDGHAWGMAIDLSVCTGCSSCVVACQSENNIPVVGKEQVLAGREMHWLRIDRYFEGDLDSPAIHNQPLPCMHCENAPCEVVCPVAATVHSDEGLNDMVYNRCVGTRYCSNNCPYKVRRFNFLRYAPKDDPLLALAMNPDVTVRMRGVMEKCSYCVQRIEEAKIESKVDRQPIPVNRLQTACQQACPTGAIVFGDQNNPEWEVTKLKAEPLRYDLLEEINTRPRTSYLAKLRNPNPALEPAVKGSEHGHA
ncbi:MAG TPA: TAT-variant-translocated molybdopterin oxidoreductase [Thermoanaerobaculia bacterium]|nr:TAT-variant-translocated molybdopterin oxidoreductase [Thermoanaerobaculia bacterium]